MYDIDAYTLRIRTGVLEEMRSRAVRAVPMIPRVRFWAPKKPEEQFGMGIKLEETLPGQAPEAPPVTVPPGQRGPALSIAIPGSLAAAQTSQQGMMAGAAQDAQATTHGRTLAQLAEVAQRNRAAQRAASASPATASAATPAAAPASAPPASGAPAPAAEADLPHPSYRAQLAFVLNHLGHAGHDKVRALILRDIAKRVHASTARAGAAATKASSDDVPGEAPPADSPSEAPSADPPKPGPTIATGAPVLGAATAFTPGNEAAAQRKRIDNIASVLFRGGMLRGPPGWLQGMGAGGLERRVKISNLVSLAQKAGDAASSVEKEGQPSESHTPPGSGEEDGMEVNEEAIKLGRELLVTAREEKWDAEEVAMLNQAFALVCGIDSAAGGAAGGQEGDVWAKRRAEWSEELRLVLRRESSSSSGCRLEIWPKWAE